MSTPLPLPHLSPFPAAAAAAAAVAAHQQQSLMQTARTVAVPPCLRPHIGHAHGYRGHEAGAAGAMGNYAAQCAAAAAAGLLFSSDDLELVLKGYAKSQHNEAGHAISGVKTSQLSYGRSTLPVH